MARQQQQETGASLRPSEMSSGGALIDDADVQIKDPEFVLYDFNGKSASKVCAKLTLVTDDDEEHVEYLSAADPKHFAPSSDGKRCVQVGDKTSLNNNSKWALFVASLVNAGFAESDIGDTVDFLSGLRVHIMRKAAPKSWSSMAPRGDSDRAPTILEVTAILEDKPAAKGKGKAGSGASAPAKGKAAKGGGASAVDQELRGLVGQAIDGTDGLSKKELVPAIFRLAGASDNKKAMVKRVYDDEFLMAGMAEGLWEFDGETVSEA